MERVIVWHRWSCAPESSRDAVALGAQWRVASRLRFLKVDAEVLLEIGGTAVFALEPSQLARAIELCLMAIRDAEREEVSGGIACGIAIGSVELTPAPGGWLGDAIDRAQALANVAEAHELLLDPRAQAAASNVFLFAREETFGLGLSGAVVDRAFPRRAECQRALVHLGRPPFSGQGHAQFEALRRLAKSGGRHRVLLIGAHGIGIGQWIARIAEELSPPVWLDVRALGASLAPLSGLLYALRRLPEGATPERLLTRGDEADQQALVALAAIRQGRAVSRRDAVLSLRQYVGRAAESGQRAFLSVDPAPLIDPSTVGVVAEAAREGGPDALVMMRLLLDSKAPEAFARGGGLSEIRVRGLSQHEARGLASSMLGIDPPNDLARRAATMGGDNPLAVAEALRVLVASGDVVFEQGAFRWRRGPAGRLDSMSVEALIEERVDALAAPMRRALEILATVPDPDDRTLTQQVAEADGLLEDTWLRAVEELDVLGLIKVVRGIGMSAIVRQVVQATMAPSRTLDLHRTVADALATRIGPEDGFALATLAYYLAHSGRRQEAASMFLDTAARSGEHGFLRSGVRLAAAAVECDDSEATRARAAQIAERLSERQPPPVRAALGASAPSPTLSARDSSELVPSSGSSPAQSGAPQGIAVEARARAVQAILARDFDEVDRAIELLVAAGRDGHSVDRLRTVTLLVKGEHNAARAMLDRLRESEAEIPKKTPHLTLTTALVSIAAGELEPAVRSCLDALARTREARDTLGERAALSVLSMCYRRLGREEDAARLAGAALARPAAVAPAARA
jgi:hypothetical protein